MPPPLGNYSLLIPFSPKRPNMLRTHRAFGMDMAQGAAAAKGDGTGGQCMGDRVVTMPWESVPWAREASWAPGPWQVQQGPHICIFRRPSSIQPAALPPLTGWRLGESPAPCGNVRRGHPHAHQSSSSCKTSSWCPLGTLCSPQVTVLGSGPSPNSAPSQALPPQFVFQRNF